MPLLPQVEIEGRVSEPNPSEKAQSPLRAILTSDPEDQDRLLDAGRSLFGIAERAREPYGAAWADYYDWARGNHWDGRRPNWRSHMKANYVFASVMSRAALLTDSRPIVRAIPRKKTQAKVIAEVVNPLMAYQWETQGLDSGLMESTVGAVIFGTYFWKPYWDPTLWDGEGECATSLVDPRYVWPDPGAIAINGPDSGEFLFHVEPRSLEWIERMFPERGGQVDPEDIPSDLFGIPRAPQKTGARTPVDQKPLLQSLPIIGPLIGRRGTSANPTVLSDIPRALVYELWLKDDTVDRFEDPEREGESEEYAERYPRGRKIIWSNGILLTPDLESQQGIHAGGRFPFVRFRNYVWPGEFHGGSDVEQVMEIQREMNLVRARISDWLNNMANGKWIVKRRSGVDVQTLSNSPLQVIQPERMDDVKRLDPMPLADGVIAYMASLQRDYENVGAYQDVQQGRVPDRLSSGLAIQEVKEAAQTRVRLTERGIKEALEEWADLTLEIIHDNYPEKRVVRVTDSKSGAHAFVTVKKDELPRRLDWEAQVGSQILKGQTRVTTNDAIQMFGAGLIDQQAALEAVDFPDVKTLLARTDNAKETILNLAKSDPAFARALIETLQGQAQQPPPLRAVGGGGQ